MRNLPRAVEIRMHARNEEQVIPTAPVGIAPRFVHVLNVGIRRKQSADKRADLRLEGGAVLATTSVVIDENRDDPNSHAVRPLLRVVV